MFDAWGEMFKNDTWIETFEELGIDMDFYTTRERALDEILPWDFIDCGVTKQFLIREWEQAKLANVSPNCRVQCQGCGATMFQGGVCFEN